MERIRKIVHKNKEILIIDYSDCRGEAMIEVFKKAMEVLLTEKRRYPILSIFNSKTLVSPSFMRHIEKEVYNAEDFVVKQAIIGISQVQVWILKGVNLWYKRQIFYFKSMDQALEFLIE